MIAIINKKKTMILIVITFILLMSFSIGYALLSQDLNMSGTLTILPSTSGVNVSNISTGTFTNGAAETTNSSINGLTATMGVSLSKGNAKANYDITIKNNSNGKVRFSSAKVTLSNDAFTYTLSGINTSTILEIGEDITCNLTIEYLSDYIYSLPSTTTSNIIIEFEFVSTSREIFKDLTGIISPTSGDITSSDNGALFNITVTNDNNFPVTYTLTGDNGFIVYNENGEIGNYYLAANSSDSFNIYINDSSTSVADNTNPTVMVIANIQDFDDIISNTLGSVKLKLKDKNKYIVIAGGGGITATPDDIDYSNSDASSSKIYAAKDINGGYTYFYRGVTSNNYFKFGGFTWRIIRIDSSGNVRLVLNDLIKNSSNSVVLKQFKTSNTATSLDGANTLLKLVNDTSDSSVNSPVYGSIDSTDTTTLRGWYNSNLKSYEDYIVDSNFCLDTTGGYITSSSTSTSVFYYGTYQRVGKDAALYSPNFTCKEKDILTEKIGLLSADEYVFSGGSYLNANTNIFINDFKPSSDWWTLSPAYYDSNLGSVGLFIVQSDGTLTDWTSTNTIATTAGVRPVITVNGNYTIAGSGTASDPYYFN